MVLYLLLPLSGSEAAKIEIRISGLWSPNAGPGQDLHRALQTRFPDYEIVAGTRAMGKFADIAAALSSGEDDLVWDSSATGNMITMWAGFGYLSAYRSSESVQTYVDAVKDQSGGLLCTIQRTNPISPSGKYGLNEDMFQYNLGAGLEYLAKGYIKEEQSSSTATSGNIRLKPRPKPRKTTSRR